MQLAVTQLRRAARTTNLIEKLEALETAEQKLRDAEWLGPGGEPKRFEIGITEISHSRQATLEQAIPAVERLLVTAETGLAEKSEMLRAAGRLLSYLNHYLPEDERVDTLNGRFLQLGGVKPSYEPQKPLAELYHRPEGGAGCTTLVVLLLATLTGIHELARWLW